MRPQGRQIAAAICLAAAVVCGIAGRIFWQAADSPGVSAVSWEYVTSDEVRQIREQEKMREEPVDFTAWREEKEARVTTEDGFCSAQAALIRLSGSSEYLPFGGTIIDGDDTEGCLIGEAVAERLFGTRSAEHLSVVCGDRTLTVRGVLKEPAEIVVFEETGREAVFDRITFGSCVKENVCDEFLNRYGLSRMQICHRGFLFRNLIPGKWSDFAGWRSNFTAEEKRVQRQRELPQSLFELREEAQRRKGGVLLGAGFLSLLAGLAIGGAFAKAPGR